MEQLQDQPKLKSIQITTSKDDYEEMKQYCRELPESIKSSIGDAVRTYSPDTLTPQNKELLMLIAYFVKVTTQRRDRELIKRTFDLDNIDIEYLTKCIAPPNEVIPHINSFTVEFKNKIITQDGENTIVQVADTQPKAQAAEDIAIQPELFPALPPPPTMAVNYNEHIIHPDTAVLATSKLAQKIHQLSNNFETRIHVSQKGTRDTIITASVVTDMPPEIKTAPISRYDRIVENAIGNLYDQGILQFTPEMVYRQMNGLTGGRTVSAKAVTKVDRSIGRLARTMVYIKCREQFIEWLKDNPEAAKLAETFYGRNIIYAQNIRLQFTDGTIKSGWKITDPPAIYFYSKHIDQVLTIPYKLLDTTSLMNSTPEMIQAKYYLIEQINRVKNTPNNKIAYDTLFEEIGDDLPLEKSSSGRSTRSKRIEGIRLILDHFVSVGWIRGYTEYLRGKRLEGVCINVEKAKIERREKR